MNNIPEPEQHRSLQILTELSGDDSLTQRDLSSRLGIALGLVNSYIKNLMAKGYITVKSIPPRRYAYFLTPKGFTEKTRLTYDLLHDYTRIYREARKNFKQLFHDLQAEGRSRIVFAGADETAEIAYLTLQETRLTLVAVVDDERTGQNFFRKTIQAVRTVRNTSCDAVVVTSYLKRKQIVKQLTDAGIGKELIRSVLI